MFCLHFRAFCHGFISILPTVSHQPPCTSNHGLHQPSFTPSHRLHQSPFTPTPLYTTPPFTPTTVCTTTVYTKPRFAPATAYTQPRFAPTIVCNTPHFTPTTVHIKPRFSPITVCYRTRPCAFFPQLSHFTPSARTLSIIQTSTDSLATDPFPQHLCHCLGFSKSFRMALD